MQLLRIDLPAELREAAEIGEHHGDLSPFAGREIDRAAFSGRSRLRLAKSRDGISQLAAVAYSGDAKVPKILGCEPGQDRAIDTIPAKGVFVLLKPQAAQPGSDIHSSLLMEDGMRDHTSLARFAQR